MLKKMFLGVLFAVLILALLIAGINFNITKAADYGSSGTTVGGIIWENTTWTLENSPYTITDTVQIPENVTLTIEPGVTVISNLGWRGNMFLLHGKIFAHGTNDNKIVFDGGSSNFFAASSGATKDTFLSLNYCIIRNGMSFYGGSYAHLNITHSEIINMYEPSWVNSPGKNTFIEHNLFKNFCGFCISTERTYDSQYLEGSVYIRCNLFVGRSDFWNNKFYTITSIGNYDPDNCNLIVKYNSFLNNNKVLSLEPGFDKASMSAPNNYWGTTDTSIIDSMIYDKNDDITCAGFIEYLPILSEPHPDTPKISSTIYVDDDNTAGPWDGTAEHPYQNITQGLKHASDNDTIFVFSGTYYENVVVNKTLCLTAENREDTIIDARGIGDVLRIEADNVTVSNFTIRYGDNGIYLSGSHGSTIRSNNITKNRYNGITGYSSTFSNIEWNIISNNGYGINLAHYCKENTIQENTVTNNTIGIYLRADQGNNTVQGNIVQNNQFAIDIHFSNGNNIMDNVLTNSEYCIYITSSTGNEICSNLVANNHWGIYFDGGNDNKIYHNNFTDNLIQAHISISFNTWDDGYPSGGNYWSDYVDRYPNATEMDGSGIWDTPYVIDENNQDNFPIIPEFPQPIILLLFAFTTLIATILLKKKARPKSPPQFSLK